MFSLPHNTPTILHYTIHYSLLILESDKDYNQTSQIKDIFPITLRLSLKVNFWG